MEILTLQQQIQDPPLSYLLPPWGYVSTMNEHVRLVTDPELGYGKSLEIFLFWKIYLEA